MRFCMVTRNPQDGRPARRIGKAKSLSACTAESGFVNHSALAFRISSKGVRHGPCGERLFELIRNANAEWLTNPDSGMQALNDLARPIRCARRSSCGFWVTMRNRVTPLKSLRAKHSARIRPKPEGAAAVTRTVLTKPVNERLTNPLEMAAVGGISADGIVPAAVFHPAR